MRRRFQTMILPALLCTIGLSARIISSAAVVPEKSEPIPVVQSTVISEPINQISISYPTVQETEVTVTIEEECEEETLSNEDVELIALVTMAEAEGECEEGKRLVIDTILNRVDSEYFPDTVYDVVYQKSQFSSMWNGRVDKCYVQDDICELVREEIKKRSNYEVMFFTAWNYGKYGTPMFQVENHYFSSYE